jgi:RNA polymerase sigma-70 factor (ECF subfamily)
VEPRYRDDGELLAAARSEPQAFAVFYDRYEVVVASYLARRVRDPEAVADLTAEVFAAVLNAAPRYRAKDATATGWLLTIAHNKLATSLRRGRVEASARKRLGIREPVSFHDDELERVGTVLASDRSLIDLLNALPADQATAIRARVLEERDYGDIAATLRTSELVIRKRVSRGLNTLRREIEEKRT